MSTVVKAPAIKAQRDLVLMNYSKAISRREEVHDG
jgi:hypothetical protein